MELLAHRERFVRHVKTIASRRLALREQLEVALEECRRAEASSSALDAPRLWDTMRCPWGASPSKSSRPYRLPDRRYCTAPEKRFCSAWLFHSMR